MKAPTDAQLRSAVLRWTRAVQEWKGHGQALNHAQWKRFVGAEAALLALGKRMEEE